VQRHRLAEDHPWIGRAAPRGDGTTDYECAKSE
jgi:hypothetical protein